MQIYLLQGGEQTGPFTPEEISQHLSTGQLPNDIPAWHEGLETWVPVYELLPTGNSAPPNPQPKITTSKNSESISITLPKPKRGWIIYGLGGLVLVFLLFYITSAYYAIYSLKSAISSGNRESLERHIDFPLVRASIKEEFKAQMMRSMSKQTGMFSGLAEMMAPAMIDSQIDSLVTPSGLDGVLAPIKSGMDRAKESSLRNGSEIGQANPFQITHVGFDSPTDFVFTIFESKVHLHYYGLGWKVYRIELVDLIAKGEAVHATYVPDRSSKKSSDTSSIASSAPPLSPKNPSLDSKNGFRLFQLGSPLSQFNQSDLSEGRLLIPNPDMRVFFVKDFDATVGIAKIDSIQLSFKQNLLCKIRVVTKGEQSGLGLKESLIAAYGQPNGKVMFSDGSKWEGEDCILEWSKDYQGDASAEFTSKKVDAQIKQITEDNAKQGAVEGAKNL